MSDQKKSAKPKRKFNTVPWYPKDWWTSDTFFILTPLQRYYYLELLWMIWSDEYTRVRNDVRLFAAKLGCNIVPEDYDAAVNRLQKEGDFLTSENVTRRKKNEGGGHTDAPRGEVSAPESRGSRASDPPTRGEVSAPDPAPARTLARPGDLNKHITSSTTTPKEVGSTSTSEKSKPVKPAQPPLRAALRLTSGAVDAVKMQAYGNELLDLIEAGRIAPSKIMAAVEHYNPLEMTKVVKDELAGYIKKLDDASILYAAKMFAGMVVGTGWQIERGTASETEINRLFVNPSWWFFTQTDEGKKQIEDEASNPELDE